MRCSDRLDMTRASCRKSAQPGTEMWLEPRKDICISLRYPVNVPESDTRALIEHQVVFPGRLPMVARLQRWAADVRRACCRRRTSGFERGADAGPVPAPGPRVRYRRTPQSLVTRP